MSENVPAAGRRAHPRLIYINNSHEEFFRGLVNHARGIGFEFCGYLVGIPQPGKNWQFVMLNNFPKAWQDRYRKQKYFAIDPTIRHAKTSQVPLVWSPDLFGTEALADMGHDARRVGFNHGWTQAARDGNGRFGALTLARSHDLLTEQELAEKQAAMLWLSFVAHSVLLRLLSSRQKAEKIALLTEREVEFLQLASEGKTAEGMSQSSGVSERTANFHIGNAMEKLGAMNKAHAVALAMRLGLIL